MNTGSRTSERGTIHRLDVVSAGPALASAVDAFLAEVPNANTARSYGTALRALVSELGASTRSAPCGGCSTRPPPEPRKSWHWTSRNWICATGGPRSAARAARRHHRVVRCHRLVALAPVGGPPDRAGLPHRRRARVELPTPISPGQRPGEVVLPAGGRVLRGRDREAARRAVDAAPTTALRPDPRRGGRREHLHPAGVLRPHQRCLAGPVRAGVPGSSGALAGSA